MGKAKLVAASVVAIAIAFAFALTGCAGNAASPSASPSSAASPSASSSSAAESQTARSSTAAAQVREIDYMALVNKLNPLPDGWEDALQTEHFTNTVGDDVEVEAKAYKAYLELKSDLAAEGVHVDLDSARRSVADQQRIMNEFTEKYGADYAKKTVAEPGYSEHHTGLALDLYLVVNGENIVENEDMMNFPDVQIAQDEPVIGQLHVNLRPDFREVHHILVLDDVAIANEIASQGITFEEYRAGKAMPEVAYDYGNSGLYTREELEEAAIQVKCDFATWKGCELHSLRYAGDECNTQENINWLNSLDSGARYVQVAEFVGNFHSPVTSDKLSTWERDTEYTDYQWWLGRTDDGSWQLVSSGY